MKKKRIVGVFVVLFALAGCLLAQSQEIVLKLETAQTTADFALDDVLHSVHGSFSLKQGTISFDPSTGTASGEIVFDAASGNSGNGSRDRKMNKDVLESQRYPEIIFRPDHAEGKTAASGTSVFQVHGRFGIHGAEHDVTIPVEVEFRENQWTAKATFKVPYVKWGMKNPSLLFLRVGDSVNITFHGTGNFSGPPEKTAKISSDH
jgi:polyisoprenoid-binding protein YceI